MKHLQGFIEMNDKKLLLKTDSYSNIHKNTRDLITDLNLQLGVSKKCLCPIARGNLIAKILQDKSITQQVLSILLGVKRSRIAAWVSILKLPARIQDYVKTGKLPYSHARMLVPLQNSIQLKLAQSYLEQHHTQKEFRQKIEHYQIEAGDIKQLVERINGLGQWHCKVGLSKGALTAAFSFNDVTSMVCFFEKHVLKTKNNVNKCANT
ncbi:Nucleoid occlusion protein [invertebrate metagenome]|uniref:Nucleoid occlusion protein n=1 Tax=invertebrate metagenome TaxID=1711999 RepID=A0A2H9T501_9ZZZZ